MPAATVPLTDILAYSNAPPDYQAALDKAYKRREAQADAVSLYRLPRRTLVSGPAGFNVLADERLLAEQVLPYGLADIPAIFATFAAGPEAENVSGDTLLVGRYGEETWGHWLVELLPKIVVCERWFPGRFRYTLFADLIDRFDGASVRWRESLEYYGIGRDRLIRLRGEAVYRFDNLYALSPVFTDFVPHPSVADLMIRSSGPVEPAIELEGKIALIRRGTRQIHNSQDVEALLTVEGFNLIDIAAQPFAQQVAAFRSAHTVFSVLGSGLSGLIYSPHGVRIVAATPELWADRFFYNIAQTKSHARWAEARGPVVDEDHELYRSSSFNLPLPTLQAALDAVRG